MTNEELLWRECNNIGRFLIYPGIYRHFKQTKDGEDMIYSVSGFSVPSTKEFLTSLINNNDPELLLFNHTELEKTIEIFRINNKYFHNKDVESEILPIYTAMYGDRKTYVRPLSMFLSKTDKEKYPDVKQKYRLELI